MNIGGITSRNSLAEIVRKLEKTTRNQSTLSVAPTPGPPRPGDSVTFSTSEATATPSVVKGAAPGDTGPIEF